MEESRDFSLGAKVFLGDWAVTDNGIRAFDRCMQATRLQASATIECFKTAFLPHGGTHVDGGSGQRRDIQGLDIGCGPGSLTLHHLLPRLPAGFQKLVAVDNSEAMLEAARVKSPHDKIVYKRLDITVDEDVARFIKENGRFDMVFSFGALHWIRDQHHAARNIAELVTPGGECFLSFAPSMPLFDIYAAMLESPRWSSYSEHIKNLIPVTHGMDVMSLRSYAASFARAANVTPLTCEVLTSSLDLKVTARKLAAFYTTSNAIYHLLSDEQKEELKKFTFECLDKMTDQISGNLIIDSQRLVIHAYKPCQ
ncbi:uncharacterized protein LOC144141977 [Haemaphysalis longicornis]